MTAKDAQDLICCTWNFKFTLVSILTTYTHVVCTQYAATPSASSRRAPAACQQRGGAHGTRSSYWSISFAVLFWLVNLRLAATPFSLWCHKAPDGCHKKIIDAYAFATAFRTTEYGQIWARWRPLVYTVPGHGLHSLRAARHSHWVHQAGAGEVVGAVASAPAGDGACAAARPAYVPAHADCYAGAGGVCAASAECHQPRCFHQGCCLCCCRSGRSCGQQHP